MTAQLPTAQNDPPAKKIWKRWKLAGLAVFAAVLIFGHWLPGPVNVIGFLFGFAAVANLLFLLFRRVKNRLFWRVRNRLIGSFIFVGVIPLLVLLGVAFLSGYVLFGQLTGRYMENSLREAGYQLTGINGEIAARISPPVSQDQFDKLVAGMIADHAAQFPRISARLLRQGPGGGLEVTSKYDPNRIEADSPEHPGRTWLDGKPNYDGLVREGKVVLLVSLHPVPESRGYYLSIATPVDTFLAERFEREKSIYFALVGVGRTRVTSTSTSFEVSVDETGSQSGSQEAAETAAMEKRRTSDPRRMITWFLILRGREYSSGKEERAGIALLHVPVATVHRVSVGESDVENEVFFRLIYVLAGMFLFAELVSLVIGFTISRRITRSAHDLYQGTLALQKGDLQHRIPVRRQDQLGLLAHSFNQMSASIASLLEEVSEKKRLEQELEIAREVQATLFPKQLPHPRGMAVFGGCTPARVVSGDYYDFIVEDESKLDIVVADISGKGISAALLMANLQAAMRNQLLSIRHDHPEEVAGSLAEVMAQLNRQIYLNSPAEKYATLFLGRYDAERRALWYCNAGHLPPILLNGGEARMLEATGMVVGLFPDARYEARSVELTPGALLAIFTDGVTEAVNGEDEEFGEDRLLAALREAPAHTPEAVYRHVVGKIRDWQGDLPQHDDITLIVARAV